MMKLTNLKIIIPLFFLIFFGSKLLAQDELNQPNLRFYLSEDKSSYAGAVFVNQIWTRYIWNNPDALGNDMGGDFDVAIRRSRAIFYTYLFDKVFMYTMLGSDGHSFKLQGNPAVSLYNAQTEYIFVKEKFHLGFGLTTWNGLSRYNNCKLLEYLVVDNPVFAFPVAGRHDKFGRQLGIYAKGTISKLHYRASVAKPFRYGVNENDQIQKVTERLNSNLALKGYFSWQFLDKEGTLMPYMTMNNLGRQRIFNVGGGFYYHPEAMVQKTVDGIDYPDIFLFAVDAFLDIPLTNGAALTSYLAFNNYNFGENYIRSAGAINVSLANPNSALAQGIGNSEWEVGTGQIIRGEFGYLLPGNGMKNRFQPYGAFSWKNFEALNEASVQFDAGINWLMNSHNLKWTLQYSSRPIYTAVDGNSKWTESKGQFLLQTQIYF
ncbi:hypothetical protein [Mariniphaga sp.]|uniref:hypothetical protein n=1 Tax=Mariniphaga sp. TaxID=1954475 RepID=UPI00356795D0